MKNWFEMFVSAMVDELDAKCHEEQGKCVLTYHDHEGHHINHVYLVPISIGNVDCVECRVNKSDTVQFSKLTPQYAVEFAEKRACQR